MNEPAAGARLPVAKTYKIYVNGTFPRTESGRYYKVEDEAGHCLANACRCSRKDVRDAVVAARAACAGWSGATPYLRGQILYRIGEMLEGRRAQFEDELRLQGLPEHAAAREVTAAIDRWVHYAGWADKFQQVFSSVNPVAAPYFNFSLLEPTGVVAVAAPEDSPLLGLVSMLAPVVAGGNTAVVLASRRMPLSAVTLGEVLQVSDVPPGVVNILTGFRDELLPHLAGHMDVTAVAYHGTDPEERRTVEETAAVNVKRVTLSAVSDWTTADAQSPYLICAAQEVKTTWHPVGR